MLIFVVHHMIADSWSLGLFAQNIMLEYTNLINNKPLIENDYSYTEYISNENTYMQSSKYENDKRLQKGNGDRRLAY